MVERSVLYLALNPSTWHYYNHASMRVRRLRRRTEAKTKKGAFQVTSGDRDFIPSGHRPVGLPTPPNSLLLPLLPFTLFFFKQQAL